MNNVIELEIGAHTSPDRVRAWTRLLDENLMGVECENASADLRASLKICRTDSGSLARCGFTSQRLFRTSKLIRQDAEDNMLLVFVQDGKHEIRQGKKTAVLDGCGTYLLDGSRPFEVDFASDEIVQATLHVPKAAITKRIGAIEDLAFAPGAPMQKLVATFALAMVGSFETLDSEILDALLNQTLDLVALMVAQGKANAINPSTHRAGMLLRIKCFIKAHLRDDELTLERTAHALGISVRYINALLATDGTSFGRYVLAMRLEEARREIMDPQRVHKQVTEIAFDWGFKNASHFGRAFKDKYGMAPRDAKWRKED